ncbi:MAG TPA: NAD-dependent epimerase/dehydratase family protein [Acidobacteriota bacterium]|nr:NAD-dependent epimerase/dehydratase family protein [Acidobacteriota bacterium]
MNKPKCLVTGGAGFIASHLVDLLVREGHEVVVVDDLSTGLRENLNPGARFHQTSVLDLEALTPLLAGCRWVFHAAAWPRIQPSFDDPLTHEAINVAGTINCLIAARDAGVRRFVYFGSSAVYGTPDEIPTTENAAIRCYNPYALHKFAGEQYCLILGERWGIPAVSLRMFNVYGARSYNFGQPNSAYSPVIGIFDYLRQQGQPLTITGSGEQSRDFVHVYDVARAFLAAAQSDVAGEVFNVGSGTSDSIKTIASLMSDTHEYIPERPNEARITHADIGKIRRLLGWEPAIGLAEGLTMLDDRVVSATVR